MYLIDGHNLIGSGLIPDIRLDQEDDEWRLVRYLRARQPNLGRPMTVVFDGGIPGGASPVLSGGGVKVIFARRWRSSADQVILARVRKASQPQRLTVVSNDGALRQAVAAAGAKTMTVAEFIQRLERHRHRRRFVRPKRPHPEPKLPKAEVEEWLRLFEERKEGK